MTDGSSWRLIVTPRAEKELKRLRVSDQGRIRAALDGLKTRPPSGDIKKLGGVGQEWRHRVGEWRIRFRFDDQARAVVITRVVPRGRAYRD